MKTQKDEFTAPEILQGSKPSDRSDVWTLGVMLYTLVNGVPPYSGTRAEILKKISVNEKKEVRKNHNELFPIQMTSECRHLLNKMLQPKAADRPDVGEILRSNLINNVKFDPQKRVLSMQKLPERMKNQFVLYQPTRKKVSYDQYLAEDSYLAFSPNPIGVARIRVTDFANQRSIAKQLEQIQRFKELPLQNLVTLLDSEIASNQLFLAVSYCNQSSLEEYLELKRHFERKSFTEKEADIVMGQLLPTLQAVDGQMQYHGSVSLQTLFVHKGSVLLGCPLPLNEKSERLLKENKSESDYFAPELKAQEANLSKADIWSYGMVFCHLVLGGKPGFDQSKQPVLPQSNQISTRNKQLITQCLQVNPARRCEWSELQKDNTLPLNFRERKMDRLAVDKSTLSQAAGTRDNFNSHSPLNAQLIGADDEPHEVLPSQIISNFDGSNPGLRNRDKLKIQYQDNPKL